MQSCHCVAICRLVSQEACRLVMLQYFMVFIICPYEIHTKSLEGLCGMPQ